MIGLRGIFIKSLVWVSSFFSEKKLVHSYLKRKYFKFMCDNPPTEPARAMAEDNEYIYVMWLQGLSQAPKVVQSCFKSLKYFNPNHRVVVLTDENVENYVTLPEHILKKYRQGKMTRIHFSDIVRTAVLYQNGGLWMDSTMFCTRKIPESIWNNKFFAFRVMDDSKIWRGGSQFIRALRGDEILGKTLLGLYKYWTDHDKMINYFMWFNFFSLATQSSKKAIKEWKETPKFYFEPCILLQGEWLEQVDFDKWDYLRNISFVQKLTYKLQIPKDISGTYFERIVSDDVVSFLK